MRKIIRLALGSGFLAGAVILLLSTAGCKQSSSSVGSLSVQDYFSLKVGNSWVYRQRRFDQSGIATFDTTGTTLISGEQTYASYHAYQYAIQGTPGFALLYYVGNDVYSVDPSDTSSKPHIIFRYPMNVGETLVTTTDSLGAGLPVYKWSVTLVGTSEPITTPAGSFTCLHFKGLSLTQYPGNTADTNFLDDSYYARGVGPVLERTYQYASAVHYLEGSFELQAYSVK